MADAHRSVQDHPKPGERFDKEVTSSPIILFVVILVIVCIVTGVLVHLMIGSFKNDAAKQDPIRSALVLEAGEQLPPEPRLQVDPVQDLATLRAEEAVILEGFGWVDEEKGIAHIPIERSLLLMLDYRKLNIREHPRQWSNPNIWRDPSLRTAREVMN